MWIPKIDIHACLIYSPLMDIDLDLYRADVCFHLWLREANYEIWLPLALWLSRAGCNMQILLALLGRQSARYTLLGKHYQVFDP